MLHMLFLQGRFTGTATYCTASHCKELCIFSSHYMEAGWL